MMEKRGIFLILAVLTILFFNLVQVLAEPINLTDCQAFIDNGYYAFNETLTQAGINPCFDIGNDTIIDCGGFEVINGTGILTDTAFKIYTGTIHNVTIRNCDLTNASFEYPVYINNVDEVTIENISSLSGKFGIHNTNNSEVKNNLIYFLEAINLGGIFNNTIKDNLINCTFANCHYFRGSFNFINNTFIINNTGASSYGMMWDTPVVPAHTKFIGNKVTCFVVPTTAGGSCVDMIGAGTTEFADNTIISPQRCLTLSQNSMVGYDNTFIATGNETITASAGTDAIFINTTEFTWRSSDYFLNPLSIIVKWHTRIKVEDASGNNVSNALVTFKYSNGSIEYSGYTNSNGILNANISEYAFINNWGNIAYFTPTQINASAYGYNNGTSVNLTVTQNALNIIIILPFNESGGANHLPVITAFGISECCISPADTVTFTIYATDPENDTIGYAYRCSDTDPVPTANFNSTNTGSCTYNINGSYYLTVYANDTSHITYNSFSQRITANPDITGVCGGICMQTKLIDIADKSQGLMPQVYFGLAGFFEQTVSPMLILGFAIFFALIMIMLGVIIKKIALRVVQLGN